MKNIYFSTKLFVKDYSSFLQLLGGYNLQFSPVVYKSWMSELTPGIHDTITQNIDSFVDSGAYRWTQSDWRDA